VRNRKALAFPLAVMVAGTIIAGAGAALAATPSEIGPAVHAAIDHQRGNPPCERIGRGNPPACDTTTAPPTCEPAGYGRGLPPCTTTSTTTPSTTTSTTYTTPSTTSSTTTSSTTSTTTSTTSSTTTPSTTTSTTGSTTTTSPSLSSTTAPPSTTPPVTTTWTPPGTQQLAYTGTSSDTGMLIGIGVLLIAGGGLMLMVRRTPKARG
jgi:LPXTG-motif cell wall-anchored protein